MPNDKLWLASADGTQRPQPAARSSSEPDCAAADLDEPASVEGLRLMRAFFRITDPSCRARLVDEAERMSHA